MLIQIYNGRKHQIIILEITVIFLCNIVNYICASWVLVYHLNRKKGNEYVILWGLESFFIKYALHKLTEKCIHFSPVTQHHILNNNSNTKSCISACHFFSLGSCVTNSLDLPSLKIRIVVFLILYNYKKEEGQQQQAGGGGEEGVEERIIQNVFIKVIYSH